MTELPLAVIGGGIVGLATAMAVTGQRRRPVVVLEAEDRVAAHQSGRNSGVIHAGLYYRPGSLKARLCTEGREALYRFCAEHSIPHERCGKVVVAADERQRARLAELETRGRANGLDGLRVLARGELAEREPHARGTAALLVPDTGVVDFAEVTRAFAAVVRDRGGEVRTGERVHRVRRDGGAMVVETSAGTVRAAVVVSCAGLQADRVARRCGLDPGCRVVPFSGGYRRLAAARAGLVRHLVYPVPDPRLPLLGVHLTRRSDGVVEAGPTALPALRAAGALEALTWPGAWLLAARYWRAGLAEGRRALSRKAFAQAVQRLVPEVAAADLEPAPPGLRAQAVDRGGRLLDDFHIVTAPGMVHVINAPSPAATASIAIGRHVARAAAGRLRENR